MRHKSATNPFYTAKTREEREQDIKEATTAFLDKLKKLMKKYN